MCGVVGIHTAFLVPNEVELFRDLMTVSNLRGSQGAGFVTRDVSDTYRYAKTAGSGITSVNSKAFYDLMKAGGDDKVTTIIGHTRSPTRGDQSVENSHPHNAPKVIGVHNGTMTNIGGKYLPASESDSAVIYQHISAHGVQDFVEKSIGAYALVWIDKEDGKLHFLRNSERPLWFAFFGGTKEDRENKTGNTMLWASEALMLEFILRRKNKRPEDYVLEELPADEHRVYDMAQKGAIVPVLKETIKKVERFWTYPQDGRAYGGEDRWSEWAEGTGRYRRGTSYPPRTQEVEKSPENTEPEQPTRWVSAGLNGIDTDHGVAIKTDFSRVSGQPEWTILWADGAISAYSKYPKNVWAASVKRRQSAIGVTASPPGKVNVNKEVEKPVSPFGQVSGDISTEADDACQVEFSYPQNTLALPDLRDARQKKLDRALIDPNCGADDALDDIFGEVDPDEDAIPFDRVLAVANQKRQSKKQRRQEAAAKREQERQGIKNHIDKVFGRSSSYNDIGYVETMKNTWILPQQRDRLIREGCAGCGCNDLEPEHLTWFDRDQFLCSDCVNDEDCRICAGLPILNQ